MSGNTDYLALRRFTDFVSSAPDAAALGASDYLALAQSGLTRRLSALAIIGGQAQWAAAGGAADAITATYSSLSIPASPTDGFLLGFRAATPNLTAAPTFSPNATTARAITKNGGQPLIAGDIPGANAECLVRFNLASTRWELLNPSSLLGTTHFVTSGASYPAGPADYFIGVNKSVGSATLISLLAAPTIGKAYIIADLKGDADVNNITISNGTFDGGGTAFYINQPYQAQGFEWGGSYWKIL